MVQACFRCKSTYKIQELATGEFICSGFCLTLLNRGKLPGRFEMLDEVANGTTDKDVEDKSQGWKVGDLCIAVYSEDKLEYEAKIIEVHKTDEGDPYVMVEYVGYGNCETVWMEDLMPLKGVKEEEEGLNANGDGGHIVNMEPENGKGNQGQGHGKGNEDINANKVKNFPTLGDFCCAIYEEDGVVYEGKLIDVTEEKDGSRYGTVEYLGYLNTEVKWLDDIYPSKGPEARESQILAARVEGYLEDKAEGEQAPQVVKDLSPQKINEEGTSPAVETPNVADEVVKNVQTSDEVSTNLDGKHDQGHDQTNGVSTNLERQDDQGSRKIKALEAHLLEQVELSENLAKKNSILAIEKLQVEQSLKLFEKQLESEKAQKDAKLAASQSELSELKVKLAASQSKVSEMNAKLAASQSELAEMNTKVITAQSKWAKLHEDNKYLLNKVDGLMKDKMLKIAAAPNNSPNTSLISEGCDRKGKELLVVLSVLSTGEALGYSFGLNQSIKAIIHPLPLGQGVSGLGHQIPNTFNTSIPVSVTSTGEAIGCMFGLNQPIRATIHPLSLGQSESGLVCHFPNINNNLRTPLRKPFNQPF